MIKNIINNDTKKEEWPRIRAAIESRILETFGTSPVELVPTKNKYEVLDCYTAHGLEHIKIKYHIFDDEWAYAVIVLPENLDKTVKTKAVITIHGTNGTVGKYGTIDPEFFPERVYGLELAKRGYIIISPDQYGFGEAMEDEEYVKKYDSFYERYPKWSLSSRRLLGHIRALDVLDQLDYVDHTGYGVIGNSLGGQATFYMAAFDDRIKAAVLSTGISPNVTNAYRNLTRVPRLEPGVSEYMRIHGRTPWELNEMLALCAPKALLCLEPFVDPYNPYTSATIDCIQSASEVYYLLEEPDKLTMYIHGDGHNTVPMVRRFAYDWFDRFMK
ncbi:MAG: alpha/beta fold hydrolase [Ruminococcaceae bacterium]|nr:alpha/beta fold hydrolase [Oscillospiraceae bacterium]